MGLVIAQSEIKNLKPVTNATLLKPDPADWPNWRRSLDGWGYSPLNQVTRQNVGQLQLAWSWTMQEGGDEATPLVYAGIMYLPSPNGVQALDAAYAMENALRTARAEDRKAAGPAGKSQPQ